MGKEDGRAKKRVKTPGETRQPAASLHTDEPVKKDGFPIVGIGASAGGLAAFETFFSSMPSDTEPGLAFVIVQHLSPDHKSILADIIQSCTKMEVFEVSDGCEVRPNCVYIIPPNKDMALLDGRLHLLEPAKPRGWRLPIDFFFRSLAQDRHEQAICIVLTGTGSDGSQGVRAVKGEGGLVIVQDPETTEHDGMPRSAIATGVADLVLPVGEIPGQLLDYTSHVFVKSRRAESEPAPRADGAIRRIFVLLRSQTGNDFSQYKMTTVYRRIERRMAINQIETMEDYSRFLQQSSAETEALYYDLLIGVTQFFRDADTFRVLEESGIPMLPVQKPDGTTLRVWVPCCSTGEEAYSIAILLSEYIEAHCLNHTFQIFATDIDSRAITTARTGVYPASIASDVTPERLRRFFTPEPQKNAYRINKNIRDMLIFSEQNIIKDPPFSRLDLISCRNFLIYLNKEIQQKLIGLFHYSLNPGGLLFLGNSENIHEHGMYTAIDHNARIFRNNKDSAGIQKMNGPVFPISVKPPQVALSEGDIKHIQVKKPLREIAEQALLSQEGMSGAIVNSRGDILYLHGRAGLYLEPAPGEAEVNNILKMAREGIRYELTAALYQAVEKKEIVRRNGLRVKTNGHFTPVNMSVHPLQAEGAGASGNALFMVVLEKGALPAQPEDGAQQEGGQEEDSRLEALKQQLRTKEEYLRAANEELDTANEELRSSNEEMQSINEELQSANEELETSREELQSINEELSTVNTELHTKVVELSKLNNDMNNMLSGTGVGTVFVDHRLRIMRFTPAATEIINLIEGDVGRPVAHIVSNLTWYDSLIEDIEEVLHTLIQKEVEVRTHAGKWYSMRIKPYRTVDNVIEGAVITFSDITDLKLTDERLQSLMLVNSESLYRMSPDWSVMTELRGRGFLADTEKPDPNWLSKYVPPCDRELVLSGIDKSIQAKSAFRLEHRVLRADGGIGWVHSKAVPILNDKGEVTEWFGAAGDITKAKEAEAALAASELHFRRLFQAAQYGILALDADTGEITGVNEFIVDLLGYPEEEILMKRIWDIGFLRDTIASKEKFRELQNREYVWYDNLPLETAEGKRKDVEFISSVYTVGDKKVIQCAIREKKRRERKQR